MPEYLVSGVAPGGRKVSQTVEAASGDLAVRSLRDQGYQHIVLHTGDVDGELRAKAEQRLLTVWTPAEWLARRRAGYLGHTWLDIRAYYREHWKLVLVLLACIVLNRRIAGLQCTVIDLGMLVLLGLPLVWIPLLGRKDASARFKRLVEAASWGRWREVLHLVPRQAPHVPAFLLTCYTAKALAGLDCLNEALQLFAPFANGRDIPESFYWSELSTVFHVAGHFDESLLAKEKSVELAADDPHFLIDLALALARRRREIDRAERLLEQARAHAIADVAEPWLDWTQGLIALERGDPHEARRLLKQALKKEAAFKNTNGIAGSLITGCRRTWRFAKRSLVIAALQERLFVELRRDCGRFGTTSCSRAVRTRSGCRAKHESELGPRLATEQPRRLKPAARDGC